MAVGAVKKRLVEDNKINMLEKEFQQIHDKLESISQQTEQMLDQIQLSEIEINYGQSENSIKFQYQAFYQQNICLSESGFIDNKLVSFYHN
ncbi:protein rapunzel-like [Tachysurus ichikawai]